MPLTSEERVVLERTNATYNAIIWDENDEPIPASQLTTLTLTLFGPGGAVINSRDAQNVLNLNNVTVSEAGELEWIAQPADNVIQKTNVPTGHYERHFALFEWTYGEGKAGKHLIQIDVQQLPKVS